MRASAGLIQTSPRGSRADEEGCAALYNKAMSHALGEARFVSLDMEEWDQTFDDALWSSLSIAKTECGSVAGFALACGYAPGHALIQMMSVEPCLQGRGMGSKLLIDALRRSHERGAISAMAYVRVEAPKAQRFYQSHHGWIDFQAPDVDYQGSAVYPVRWRLAKA